MNFKTHCEEALLVKRCLIFQRYFDFITKQRLMNNICTQLVASVFGVFDVWLMLPFPKQALVFTCLQDKSFENGVGKGEIATNEQFLHFPKCFLQGSSTYRLDSAYVGNQQDAWEEYCEEKNKNTKEKVEMWFTGRSYSWICLVLWFMTSWNLISHIAE